MSLPKVKGLSSEQSEAMVRLSRLPAFADLVNKVEADEVSVVPLYFCCDMDIYLKNSTYQLLFVDCLSFLAILHVA